MSRKITMSVREERNGFVVRPDCQDYGIPEVTVYRAEGKTDSDRRKAERYCDRMNEWLDSFRTVFSENPEA